MARQYRLPTRQELRASYSERETANLDLAKVHFDNIVNLIKKYESDFGYVPPAKEVYNLMKQEKIRVNGLEEVRLAIDTHHARKVYKTFQTKLEDQE